MSPSDIAGRWKWVRGAWRMVTGNGRVISHNDPAGLSREPAPEPPSPTGAAFAHLVPGRERAAASAATAREDGRKRGSDEERARMKAIICSEPGKKRRAAAVHLACHTSLRAEEAVRILEGVDSGVGAFAHLAGPHPDIERKRTWQRNPPPTSSR